MSVPKGIKKAKLDANLAKRVERGKKKMAAKAARAANPNKKRWF